MLTERCGILLRWLRRRGTGHLRITDTRIYSYDGEYQDSYMLGDEITLTDDTEIANVKINSDKASVMYRLTDIYQQNYWTPELP